MATYAAFARCYPDADQLIRALCTNLGRNGKCAFINPAIGYVLRQKELFTIIVTAGITSQDFYMDVGNHCWNLVSDGRFFWHVDAANPFQHWKWCGENLSPDYWARLKKGQAPDLNISIDTLEIIWGRFSSYGITISPETLSAENPFFDNLDKVGKKDMVRELFRVYGFEDPYEFTEGVLDITGVNIPL
jgi:hypothetical protein